MSEARPPFNSVPANVAFTQPPDPQWRAGDGLSPNEALDIDPEVYDLFERSRTAKGQEELFTRVDPYDKQSELDTCGILPRPIGFVSSLDNEGRPNLAPFSFFQAAGHNPPLLFLHFTTSTRRDSYENIKLTKEFTVNIISEPFIQAANYSAINAPADVSEWALSGLTQAPSKKVKAPRVAESAYSMECTLRHFLEVYDDDDPTRLTGVSVIGRVQLFHIRTDLITERGSLDPSRLLPVSRLGGISYGRTLQVFDIPRPVYDNVKDQPEVKAALQRGVRVISQDDGATDAKSLPPNKL